MNLRMERRRFLKAVGATALTFPFLRSLPSYADGASGTPKYLVLLFTPCGVVRHLWGAQGPARPTTGAPLVTQGLTFRQTLAPLAPVADQVIVLDGLNAMAAQGSHEAGMAALWTGLTCTGNPATGPSIDQVIAQKMAAGRPFDTIPLMVRSSADFTDREVKTRMIYNPSGGFVDPYDDPVAARSTFFPNAASPSGSSSSSGPDKTTFIRQKVFAQINSELTTMQGKLCTEDRAQLQGIQGAWNDLDKQLQQAATAAASCTAPGAAPAGYASPSIDFPTTAKLQMDLLAMALACDLTRVASLQFSTATSQVTHSWIDSTQTDTHHNYSHVGPTYLGALGMDLYTYPPVYQYGGGGAPAYAPQLTGIDLWYSQQVAYLANRLSQFSVGGKNLLSQSVICWGSELDMGAAHNHDDTPFVLVGSAGGALKTNQLVQFPLKLDANTATSSVVDRNHNDLLLTLASAMGVDLGGTFGTASYCTGPIKEILA